MEKGVVAEAPTGAVPLALAAAIGLFTVAAVARRGGLSGLPGTFLKSPWCQRESKRIQGRYLKGLKSKKLKHVSEVMSKSQSDRYLRECVSGWK